MCGIVGFYQYHQSKDEAENLLKRMLSRIRYRGPDESGIYIGNEIGLGIVRLSILDLETGSQPLSNGDQSLWIVYNGEIFNYIELRQELKRKGHTFRTQSDTEVIVHLYEEYGPAFLNKLNGQFAFAIWDKRKNELFLARDRVGIRPLFYTKTNETFIFSSEIKSFLEYPDVVTELSPIALSQVFTFWTTLTPNTVFENIYEVPPGHFMIVRSSGYDLKSYWELPLPGFHDRKPDKVEDAIEEFNELFNDSVKIRLRADVPVGAYLSGGIDSSITTSYIKNIYPGNLRTFSIGFTEEEFDESFYQRMVIDFLKTDHTSIMCSPEDIAGVFPYVVWHSEIPILRTAPAPMYFLSKVVRENNYKVVITGEGADELFAGYNIFKETIIRHFWAREPQSNLRPLLLKKLYPYMPQMKDANNTVLKLFFGYKLTDTNSPVYSHLLRWNNTSRIRTYFSDKMKDALKGYHPIQDVEEKISGKLDEIDPLTRAQWLEVKLFLSGYLLSSQGDRMAMANSVEGRYPFLDHRILEFCMKLPPDLKLHGLNEKYLLKRMMKGRLPDPIIERSKQAYRAPVHKSFISQTVPDYVKFFLSREQILSSEIFNPDLVEKLIQKTKPGIQVTEIDDMALTGLLSTQLLYHQFIIRKTPDIIGANLSDCKLITETAE